MGEAKGEHPSTMDMLRNMYGPYYGVAKETGLGIRPTGAPTKVHWEDYEVADAEHVSERDEMVVRIAVRMREILEILGVAGRPGMHDTPMRYAEMMVDELCAGLGIEPHDILNREFDEAGVDEMVAVHHIPFWSMCEHHVLPFFGHAHIGYIPEGRIVGISKLARLARTLASQPQVQERLTNQIADAIEEVLKPKGAIVVIEARHLCMEMRGVQAQGSLTTTSALRGVLLDPSKGARQEFLTLITGR